ncbi:hypothetical protein GZH53_07635 [Flavihumibacter sp. R14]|nr:hypothetical protein [Flavihumibacter soli]
MHTGFLRSILYYVIGLGLAGLSYLTVGHEYIHAPGLHHVIIFLTFIGGFLWLAGVTIRYFGGQRTEILKGIIFANLFMSVGFALFMVYIINDSTGDSGFEGNAGNIRIEKSGDTTSMYHDGSIIYIKVKDSVLINLVDSTKIELNEVD